MFTRLFHQQIPQEPIAAIEDKQSEAAVEDSNESMGAADPVSDAEDAEEDAEEVAEDKARAPRSFITCMFQRLI